MPTAEEAAAANAAYRAANGYPVDPNNTRILSTPEGQAYLQNQQRKAAADDAYLDQQKHDRAFSQPRNDNDVPRSAAFLAINAEYAASRNRVTTSGGSVYQGAVSNNVNPYAENTAAGIAWDVAKTGGATDLRLNVIATQQIASVGGDASFIRYATDIYIERPSYPQETLTTRDGQTFVNPEWSGVPIRANLTVAEMREGLNPSGKYYQYNQETHMLDKFTGNIPVDPGVHTKFGDFGGPILQRDGSYGGWTPNGGNGRLVGGGKVAAFGERIDATSPQNVEVLMAGGALPKPFRAGGNVTTISKPSERWETGIPLIGGFIPAGIFNPTSQVREPGRAFVSWIAPTETTTITSFGETTIDRSDMPKMAGAEATMMFIGADNKPTRILTEKTGAPYEKGGQIFQDYTTTDISKVTMSQSSSITTVGNSPAGTMLEGWNAKASSAMGLPTVSNEQIKESGWVAGLIPGGVPFAIALKTPILGDYTASYLQGEYTGFRTRPIDTIAFTGVGMAMGGITKSAGTIYAPVRAGMAEPAIASRGGRLAMQYSDFLTTKAIPYSLVGMYGTDVAGRSTEWGRDFSPMSAQRLGGIVSTEARPMMFGAMVGYAAPGKISETTRTISETARNLPKQVEFLKQDYASFKQTNPVQNGEIIWAADNRPPSGARTSPSFRDPTVFEYAVERAGFNKAPSPEIARPTIAPENEFATGSAYGKQPTIPDYIIKKANTPIRAEPKTLGNYALDEYATTGAYGRQNTIIDVMDKASRSGKQVEPYRKFFTEKTSNTLSQKAYPEASEPVGMRIKAYLQENTPLFESTKDNIIYPKQKIADYNKMYDLNKKFYPNDIGITKPSGGAPQSLKANIIPSRTTNKIVGGKSVRGLAREPSLRSQGIPETPLPEGQRSFASQHSVDFRGTPQSSTMKPMGKQAAGQIQVMREPLPMIEGMNEGMISPRESQRYPLFQPQMPQQRQTTETMMEISPRREFIQDYQRRQELSTISPTTLGNLQNQLQMQKQKKVQFVGMDIAQETRRESVFVSTEKIQPAFAFRSVYDQTSSRISIPATERKTEYGVITTPSTARTPITTVTQRQNIITETGPSPVSTIKTIPYTQPPTVPGGGFIPPFGGGRGTPQRGYGIRSAVATHSVGADLLGASRGSFTPMTMPRGKKGKKMGMPSFRMPRF